MATPTSGSSSSVRHEPNIEIYYIATSRSFETFLEAITSSGLSIPHNHSSSTSARTTASSSSSARTSPSLSDKEIKEIKQWIQTRNHLLEGSLELPREKDICPITQDNIYDLVILDRQKFEKSALLEHLLIDPRNPITRKAVTTDTIREIFQNRNRLNVTID